MGPLILVIYRSRGESDGEEEFGQGGRGGEEAWLTGEGETAAPPSGGAEERRGGGGEEAEEGERGESQVNVLGK